MTLDDIKQHFHNGDLDDLDDGQLLLAQRRVMDDRNRLIAEYGVKFDDVFDEITLLNHIDFALGELIRLRCETRERHEEALRLRQIFG